MQICEISLTPKKSNHICTQNERIGLTIKSTEAFSMFRGPLFRSPPGANPGRDPQNANLTLQNNEANQLNFNQNVTKIFLQIILKCMEFLL